MIGTLIKEGYALTPRPEDAQLIIINTCAFIRPAVEESIEEILELARFKRQKCRFLIVTGCLPRRYGRALRKALPEVDLFLGPGEIPLLSSSLQGLISGRPLMPPISSPRFLMTHRDRSIAPAGPSAYLKISEGCSNFCSYCLIPRIRGKTRSRPPSDILAEAEFLAKSGVKEIILIAQDTTAYGKDLPGRPSLAELIKNLALISDISWIRLLYTHPAHIEERLMRVLREEEKICPYLDMPIQHVNDKILESMNRSYRRSNITQLISTARQMVPDIALRTTIIVGFPGETEKRFQELLHFIKTTRFAHLGVFTYFPEEGTRASRLKATRVTKREKELRHHIIMEEQAIISREINEEQVGTVQEILIEGISENPEYPYVGRTRKQAPEIDGVTYVQGNGVEIGKILNGRIVKADTYDLYARIP